MSLAKQARITELESQVERLQRSYLDAEEDLIPLRMKRTQNVSEGKWRRIYRSDLHDGDLEPMESKRKKAT